MSNILTPLGHDILILFKDIPASPVTTHSLCIIHRVLQPAVLGSHLVYGPGQPHFRGQQALQQMVMVKVARRKVNQLVELQEGLMKKVPKRYPVHT